MIETQPFGVWSRIRDAWVSKPQLEQIQMVGRPRDCTAEKKKDRLKHLGHLQFGSE